MPGILLPLSSPHTMIKSSQSYLLQVSLYLSCGHLLSQTCTQPVSWEANIFACVFPATILRGAATCFVPPKKVDLVVSFLFFSITENLYIFFKVKFKCPESYTGSPSRSCSSLPLHLHHLLPHHVPGTPITQSRDMS